MINEADAQLGKSMLTVTEVGKLLHAHGNTIRRWANQGVIKVYRISSRGDRRFRREDILQFLVEQNANYLNKGKIMTNNMIIKQGQSNSEFEIQ